MNSNSNTKKQIKNTLRITIKIIEWILIIILVGCMLKIFAQRICGETPSLFGYSTYTIISPSMTGTYDVGDVVVCKNDKNPTHEEYKAGEVIAFIAPQGFGGEYNLAGHIVTHRIVVDPFYDSSSNCWYVYTQGDAIGTNVDDVPIPIDNIKGKIVSEAKLLSKLGGFLSKWYGFLVIIVLPLCALLFWQIHVFVKENMKIKEQKMKEQQKQEIIDALEKEKELKQKEREEEIKKIAIKEYLEKSEK